MQPTVNAIDLTRDGRDDYYLDRDNPRDKVKDKEALPLRRLEQYLQDISQQPNWRAEADKAVDYYDGNQLDEETVAKLRERGLGPLIQNLIKPTIDAVLGLEAKTRTDWMVVCEDDQWQPVVDATNSKMKEAERETRADRACSDAFAGQCKAGFHVVEVSRQTNPFMYPYRVLPVHRREIWWDWRSLHPQWEDARWLVRKRWQDADVVAAFFPESADLIRHAAAGWPGDWAASMDMTPRAVQMLMNGHETERRTSIDDMEWRDYERGRVCVYEVWYRTYHRGAVLTLPNGRKVEYDHKNPVHVAAVASGRLPVRVGVFDRLRLAYFVGPHRVMDVATTRRRFPYIPFWGYREDLSGVPYGLIRSMLSPQDEVNARRAKMMWLLSAKRILIDNDALDEKYNTLSTASRELSRADAFVVLDAARANGQHAVRVDENMELAEQQFKLLQEAKGAVQEAGGIYAAMMGQNSNATTGVAIQSLIEQGTMTLAEINDNYFFARRAVGEALLELIQEDLTGVEMQMVVDTGLSKKSVYINRPAQHPETGLPMLENDVGRAPLKVALTDVPSTPSFRAQQFTQLAEIAKSLPPQIQAFVVPFIIESSELQKRKELASILRKQLGIDIDPNSPEGKQALEAQAQQQQQMAQLAMQEAQAKIAELAAKAEKLQAEAAKVRAEAGLAGSPADQALQQEAAKMQQEIQKLQGEILILKTKQAADLQAAQMKVEADLEKARLEIASKESMAQIEAEGEMEVARINAEAQAQVDAVMAKVDQTQSAFEEKLRGVEQGAKDRESKAREESAKKEAEQAKKEAEASKKKDDDKPREPMVVVVPGGGGGKRKRKIKFQSDEKGALIGADVEDDEE